MAHTLTQALIEKIADHYGFEASDRIVRDNAEQAISFHGTQADAPNWGTDEYGRYDAARLLEGYLAEEARCARADSLSYRDFCRNAY